MSPIVEPSTAAPRTSRSRWDSGFGPALQRGGGQGGVDHPLPASTRLMAAASSLAGLSLTMKAEAPASMALRR